MAEPVQTHCPLCRNRCALDALQCDKGRKFKAKQQAATVQAAATSDNQILDIYIQNGW